MVSRNETLSLSAAGFWKQAPTCAEHYNKWATGRDALNALLMQMSVPEDDKLLSLPICIVLFGGTTLTFGTGKESNMWMIQICTMSLSAEAPYSCSIGQLCPCILLCKYRQPNFYKQGRETFSNLPSWPLLSRDAPWKIMMISCYKYVRMSCFAAAQKTMQP